MFIWFIIITVIIVLLVVLAVFRKHKADTIEKFVDASAMLAAAKRATPTMATFLESISGGPPTAPSLMEVSTAFTSGQENYLQNVIGKEVMTNSKLPDYANVMDPAVNQPDVFLNTPAYTVVRNLQTDTDSKFTEADVQWCKSAKMPANLPAHVRGSIVGCGWYYIPDPKLTSSGALGKRDGPIYPKGPNGDGVNGIPGYGNGQWIWNLTIAQHLEEIKNCARIKSCIAIDAPSVNGICGFCTSSGVAIPVKVDGTEKYSTAVTIDGITAGAASCNTKPIVHASECGSADGATLKGYVAPDGTNCGNYGYPSDNYAIRLYKQDDCVNNMNGNWASTGECSMQGGGSYSAVCSPLNKVKASPAGPATCTPDINGKLSTNCLVLLAKSLGYTTKGAIIKMLQTKDAPGELDKVAIQIVTGENVPVDPTLYTGGIISVPDAIAAYDNIFSLIKLGSSPITQQAAMWLCIGTTGFDPCNLPDGTPGPFFPQCVQQQWRIAGCQPAGTEYPSQEATLNQLNTLSWGAVKSIFENTFNAMKAESDPIKQDIAVARCLGITTKRSTPPPCVGISRDALIINLDGVVFGNADAKAAYTTEGKWKSMNAVYTGDVIASGTKVSDAKGAQFDGTTVMGTPNLIVQMLGGGAANVLNAPDSSKLEVAVSSPAEPAYIYGEWVGRNVPIVRKDIDDSGNIVYMMFDDNYTKMVNSKKVGKYYTGPIEKYASNAWSTYKVAPDGVYLLGGEKKAFTAAQPIMTGWGSLRDIGYPPGGIQLYSDQKTMCDIRFNYAIDPVQSPDGTLLSLVKRVNEVIAAGDQNFTATVTLPEKGLSFTGPVTQMYTGWFNTISVAVPGPVAPAGDYYLKQNGGKNIAPFTAWDGLADGVTRAEISVNLSVTLVETRELWVNPNVDTCEILAIFGGTSYTDTWTEMAIFKGQLVIGLKSLEKGYTFFNAGNIYAGQWSHIVHVYKQSGGVHEIYVNGAGPVTMRGLTRKNYGGYLGYSLGGGAKVNPLYQQFPAAMPFKGQIGAFRVYNRAFGITDVQNNLAATIGNYVGNKVELATKNDPNALAMAAGKFYVPMLGNSINYQPSPE